jgi:transposase InsO family protein
MGVEKLRHMFLEQTHLQAVPLGRDWCFDQARIHGLLAGYRRRRGPATTQSRHRFGYAPYLAKQMVLGAANQLWVADITYMRTGRSWAYLSLLTDAYSRKIVGWHLSESLHMEGPLKALRTAVAHEKPPQGLVHHSDRGIQYACIQYRAYLNQQGIQSSMTEWDHCYENAMAERVNGILKTEYFLDNTFKDIHRARRAAKQAIWLYNNRRPHRSINLNYPAILHAS